MLARGLWSVAAFMLCPAQSEKAPRFPLQFSGNLTITAHQLPPDLEYPPRVRSIFVHYDYENLRARADIAEGYEAAKVYYRRYDLEQEYMVRLPPIDDCKRSFLGELMPFPLFPVGTRLIRSDEVIDGVPCHYFLFEEHDTRVHIYLDAVTGAPVRLLQEATDSGVSTPMLTYDYSNVVLGAPAEDVFALPASFSHESCGRHVGGFPYLHIFHYFVKF
jgi:hypothetical protein